MKKIIAEEYGIECLIFIKVSQSVFRIKTDTGQDFCLKYVKNDDLNAVYAHVNMLHIDFLLLPLLNKSGQYVTKHEDKFFIITEWYPDELVSARSSRLKYYLNVIALMHKHSVYSIRVNDGFFKDTYDFVLGELEKTAKDLDDQLTLIERLDYRSPSQWLLLLNNQHFYQALRHSKEHLERFKDITKDKTSIRLSLVYQNFNYAHVNVKEHKLISTHNLNFAPPIYDIKHLYDASYYDSIDLSGFDIEYLQYFPLLDYEREWLLALLLIPQIDFSGSDEIDRIVRLTRSLHHIRGGNEIDKLLTKFLTANADNKDRH